MTASNFTAIEILNQIGNNTRAIIGASTYLYDNDGIQFKVSCNSNINTVVIKLNGLDLYDIEFWYCKVIDQEPFIINNKVKTENNVYNDQLADILKMELLEN